MDKAETQAVTLRELLVEIRNGFTIFSPILIRVHQDVLNFEETTMEHTLTKSREVEWGEEYTREYAGEEVTIVGSNSLTGGLDQSVSIGRSRKCDVRVENASVSKVHAAILFDRASGGYLVVDQSSRNGTCINGEPVRPGIRTPLWAGAYVSFGDAVFVFIDPPTLRKLSRLAS